MILLFGLSMLLTGGLTYVLFLLLQLYYVQNADYDSFVGQARQFIRNIGDFNFFFVFFIISAFLFFYILTKPYSRYFSDISEGINHLARGDFDHTVSIQSNDEFMSIGEDINVASEKLQEAINQKRLSEDSKDQLVVNLAHDLRTPLTSVLGYLDLVITDPELSEEQVQHYLSVAFNKSKRLERLIDELFEITRMNYGLFEVDKNQLDLASLLIQLKEELYPLFKEAHLSPRIKGSETLIIEGDGDALARVFENLLSNAIRYGSDGTFVDIRYFSEPLEAVIHVVNYGTMIPEAELPHLFDMFYIGDESRAQHEDSTGLGLFIAKNIVEQHAGSISVQSDQTQTVFEVRLPLPRKD